MKSASRASLECAASLFAIKKYRPDPIMVPVENRTIVTSSPLLFTDVSTQSPMSVSASAVSSTHSSAVLRSLPAHISSLMNTAENALPESESKKIPRIARWKNARILHQQSISELLRREHSEHQKSRGADFWLWKGKKEVLLSQRTAQHLIVFT